MKTLILFILFLLLSINLIDAQQTQPNNSGKKSIVTFSPQKTYSFSDKQRSVIPLNPQKTTSASTLNLTALIQGFYNGTSMSSVNPITVTVELHDATTLEGVESQSGTLSSTGLGSFTFTSAIDGIPYYIVVKSGNTVETWSSSTHAFISGSLSYDFTSASAQALGNNLLLIGSKYCIYSGDVNQDGMVDLTDLIAIDNDNTLTGNINTDVNGDGTVNSSDLVLAYDNNINYISKTAPFGTPPDTIIYAAQTYHRILIGTQYWLKENLNVGDKILGTQDQTNNSILEKYCYNNVSANCITYGGLYQWNEALQYAAGGGKVQGICPADWHIPSTDEFSTLATYVAGNSNSLKSVGQGTNGGSGTNASGFSELLAGFRISSGSFTDLGIDGYFWSSTPFNVTNGMIMSVSGFDSTISQYSVTPEYGFSVRCVKNGWLSLHSPIGGESWQVGTVHNISWTSSNITNAKIELTTNNGTSWTTIIASTPASDASYAWTIPNSPSIQCKVKISDASDTTIKSISTNLFTIWIPTISLSSPNGGENWKVGEIDTIKWVSTNVADVRIDYSTNNGTNWSTISASTSASAGSFAWTIPFTPTTNSKVRIVDIVDTTIFSISASVFTIYNPPCPGLETVVYGSQTYNTVLIGNQCWLKENLNIGTRINGLQEQTNNSILEKYCYNNDPANCTTYGGLYQWAEAVQYQNGATNTTSPSPAFVGHVQGICPSGWHIPDTSEYSILLNIVNYNSNPLKAVGQGAGSGIGTDLSGFSALFGGVRYTDGSFNLLDQFNFFAMVTEGNAGNIYYLDLGKNDTIVFVGSNPKFYGRSLRCIKDDSISIQSPNGGESWQVGSNHNITWTSSYLVNAKIEYSTDNGTTWTTIIGSTPAAADSYLWTIPNTPSVNCKVRISNASNSGINSSSASVFTISN